MQELVKSLLKASSISRGIFSTTTPMLELQSRLTQEAVSSWIRGSKSVSLFYNSYCLVNNFDRQCLKVFLYDKSKLYFVTKLTVQYSNPKVSVCTGNVCLFVLRSRKIQNRQQFRIIRSQLAAR